MQLSGHTLALLGLLFAVGFFYSCSLFLGGRPKTVNSFFHQENLYFNTVSLIASNFGLGLVLISSLIFSQVYGGFCFLFPLAMFIGQSFFSRLITRLDPGKWCNRGTILSGLSDELDRTAKGAVHFQQFASFFILVTQMMALCYEVYASSEWFSITLLPSASVTGKAMIISMIIFAVMTYIMTGGYRTTQITDCLQCVIALPFFVFICVLLFSFTSQQDSVPKSIVQLLPIPSGWIGTIGFGTILISSFTTQIYSVLNHAFASHQKTNDDQRKLFLRARIAGIILNWTILFAALYCSYNGGIPKGVVEQWLVSKTASASLVIALVTAAMVAMVMSTVDTLVMATAQSGFESFFHGDSRQEDGERLPKLRISMLAVYILAFLIIISLLLVQPKILQLLYAMASPCEVLAPIIICLCYLARDGQLGVIVKPVFWKVRFIDIFYILLGATLVTASVAMLKGYAWSGMIGFSVFVISGGISYLVWLKRDKPIVNIGVPTAKVENTSQPSASTQSGEQ